MANIEYICKGKPAAPELFFSAFKESGKKIKTVVTNLTTQGMSVTLDLPVFILYQLAFELDPKSNPHLEMIMDFETNEGGYFAAMHNGKKKANKCFISMTGEALAAPELKDIEFKCSDLLKIVSSFLDEFEKFQATVK